MVPAINGSSERDESSALALAPKRIASAKALEGLLVPCGRYWRISLATFVVVASTAIGLVWTRGFSYQATASLLIYPPTYQLKGPSNEFMPPLLDVPSYARLMVDDAVLQNVCERVAREKPALWKERQVRGQLIPEVLRKQVTANTEVVEKTPQSVRYSNAITLRTKAKSSEQAKHLMDVWSEVCVAKAREFAKPGLELTVEFIRGEYENARQELEKREKALSDFQTQNNLPMLRKLMEVYEAQVAEYSLNLSQIRVKIAENGGTLSDVQAQLAKEERKTLLTRSPSDDTVAIVHSLSPASVARPGSRSFADEIVNSVFVSLRERETALTASLGGLQSQQARLLEETSKLEAEVETLNARCVKARIEEERLQRDVTAGKTYYELLARQREDMTALEANLKLDRASYVVVANAAVQPKRPSNELTVWLGIPAGALLALLASLAVANLTQEVRRVRIRSDE